MKINKYSAVVGAVFVVCTSGAMAADGMITGVTVTPANPKPNEAITVKVTGTVTGPKKCRILFVKGDGTAQSQVGFADFPLTFGGQPYPLYVYSQPGTYTVKVLPSNGPNDAVCTGSAQTTVKVSAPLAVGTIKPGIVVLGANPCPPNWHKVSGSADGAFTCKPNKPATKIQCPPKTQYVETDCEVGCQQIIY
jgi:hypothetical protein